MYKHGPSFYTKRFSYTYITILLNKVDLKATSVKVMSTCLLHKQFIPANGRRYRETSLRRHGQQLGVGADVRRLHLCGRNYFQASISW